MESRNKHDEAPDGTISAKRNLGKSQQELLRLIKQLSEIRGEMIQFADKYASSLHNLDPAYDESAKNLLHYLAFRRHDLRVLQSELAELGLSSLGRSESHVMATIEAVLQTLSQLADFPVQLTDGADALDFKSARKLLENHTKALLGPLPKGRSVHIMVTMPSEAADDYGLVLGLVNNGMSCMRINCAHDDREKWIRMIENLRRAVEGAQAALQGADGSGRTEAAHRTGGAGPAGEEGAPAARRLRPRHRAGAPLAACVRCVRAAERGGRQSAGR